MPPVGGDFGTGFVGALTDGINQMFQRNLQNSLLEQQQERAVFEHLLKSGDPELAALGLTGLLEKPKRNLFGHLKKSPIHGQVGQILKRLQTEAAAPDQEVTIPGAAPKSVDNFAAAGVPQPPPTADLLQPPPPAVDDADFEFERRQLGASKHPALLGSGPTAPGTSLAQPFKGANEAGSPLSPMAAAGTGAPAPPTSPSPRPPMPGLPPTPPGGEDDPQQLIRILQPTPDMKVRLDNPAKLVSMLRLRALKGDPQARMLADMAMQDASAGVPFQQIQQKVAQAMENAADPGGALLDRQTKLEQLRSQNRLGVEGVKQEGREKIVGMQQAGADRRVGMQQEGAMARARLGADVRWGIARERMAAADAKTGQEKPLSGEAAKVYSITRTMIPEVRQLQQKFRQDYRGTLGGFLSGTDRETVKLVDQIADKVGRLRSGGAINRDEEARFKRQLGSVMDMFFADPDQAITALDGLITEADTVAGEIRPTRDHLAGVPPVPPSGSPAKSPASTGSQRKQFRNKQTGQMQWFRLEGGQWVPE